MIDKKIRKKTTLKVMAVSIDHLSVSAPMNHITNIKRINERSQFGMYLALTIVFVPVSTMVIFTEAFGE